MSPIKAAQPDTLSLGVVLRALQTPDGEALVQGLLPKVKPSVSVTGEDWILNLDRKALPKDRFERAVTLALFRRVVPQTQVGKNLGVAITDVLLKSAAPDGQLDLGRITRKLGPQAVQFLERLAQVQPSVTQDPLADRLLLARLDPAQAQKAAHALGVEAPKLPALAWFKRELAGAEEFKDFKLLGLQHLFMSSTSLFDALADTGIAPASMRLIGKVYSTSYRAVAYLTGRGVSLDKQSEALDSEEYVKRSMAQSIERELATLIADLPHPPEATPTPRVLLLDDGAEAIRALHQNPKLAPWAGYFVCVEQTRRGARVLHELEAQGGLKCAVANVAETWAKLEHESPMIGYSVCLEVQRKLDQVKAYGVDTPKEAVVIGFGAVGQAVARSLVARGFAVHVSDPDPAKRAAAEAAGCAPHAALDEALPHGHVLVSCVGERTLAPSDRNRLPDGAILFNAASSNDELPAAGLMAMGRAPVSVDDQGRVWSYFCGKPLCQGYGRASAHSDTVLRTETGKELLLVNNGYVVNMTGEADPIPPRYIQLTRTLLFLGALAARRKGSPGIVDVPMEWQKALVRLVERELKKTHESLAQPRWDEADGYPAPVIHTPSERVQRELAAREKDAVYSKYRQPGG